MSATSGNHVPFQVHVAQTVANELKLLMESAAHEGTDEVIRRSLRRVFAGLKNDAREFGEPHFRLPAMKLTIRLGVVRPVAVDYGVHDDKPLVFVRGVRLLSIMEL